MSRVTNFIELLEAVDNREEIITIERNITLDRSLILGTGTNLVGEPQENDELPTLIFQDSDGIGLIGNNSIMNLNILAPADHKAIFNSGYTENLGDFLFQNLTLTGQLSFITKVPVLFASIKLDNINILNADTRHCVEQPQRYGVNVLQGALTIYNFNSNPDSLIDFQAKDLTIGQRNNPVYGSGVFIAGFGDHGGRVEVEILQTNEVHATGKLPFGISDIITGAIFIVNGVHAKSVIQNGETITYGVNDMVLDAWGSVDNWIVNEPVISYDPSGIGFVNFGIVKSFTINAPIETYGQGARAYNQYDGTLEKGHFSSITTFGDGSIGIQISKEVGDITIDGDISTYGGLGNSLVKGVNMKLPASALSVKNGGIVHSITVAGNIQTFGDHITSYVVDSGGIVRSLNVVGTIIADGKDSNQVSVAIDGESPILKFD